MTDHVGRMEERGEEPRDFEALKFAHQVADGLQTQLMRGAFDRLLLVGAPKFLGLLRRVLSPNVLARVSGSINKDFAKLATRDIEQRLQDHLVA